MKLKDIEGALSLIAAFKNADWVDEHLKALLQAKVIADKAIAEQKSIQAGNEASLKALEALMADHRRQEASLADRELRLKDAEEQHQFRMESDIRDLNQSRANHQQQIEKWTEEIAEAARNDTLKTQYQDKREKTLDARAEKYAQRERDLTERERVLQAEMLMHAEKVKKLRELTA